MAKKKTKKTKKAPKKRIVRKKKPVGKKAKKQKPLKRIKRQEDNLSHRTRIRIISVGGGGGSIVSEIAKQVKKVDFVISNTDIQALKETPRGLRTFQFGQKLTRGLGTGMDARIGQKAAKDESEKIAKLFSGIDLCILVSSLGGGTGSGAAPEFARIAKESGAMVFGIFTLPFKFEGGKRMLVARNSLEKLTPNLNAISIIPNENVFKIIDKKTPLREAFSAINKRLAENLRGLVEMIYVPGLVNIDFADIKTILDGRGKLAYLNSAENQGPNRVEETLKDVLHSPLNEYDIKGAEKIIFNITASQDVGMKEVEQISRTISDFNRRAKIIFGISQDNSYRDKIRICLLALGCGKEEKHKPKSKPQPAPAPAPEPEPEPPVKKPVRKKPKKRKKPIPKKKQILKPKPKAKKKIKAQPIKKIKKKKLPKLKPVKIVLPPEEPQIQEEPKVLTRRNALDLRKEVQKTEEEMEEKEKVWDVPAFLRRKAQGN